jgi:hypothetical protein
MDSITAHIFDDFQEFLRINFDGTGFFIDISKFNASKYSNLPLITDQEIQRLIDLLDDPILFEIELSNSIQTYRIFTVESMANFFYARPILSVLYLQVLLENPQNDALLQHIYSLGHCAAITKQGVRCRKKATLWKFCKQHSK